MMLKIQLCITGMNYILNVIYIYIYIYIYIKQLLCNISQYDCLYCIYLLLFFFNKQMHPW